ncbi:unnamed protein product [Cylicocyclus nassatus]|uniref:Uncharacterized protein n=1 Tax=Cylicocyclus nassatus TaxID=53992 RepID=A0AA36MDS0_CYLNA|nr:unnamed protein product [Cylicocyclus nassatus]
MLAHTIFLLCIASGVVNSQLSGLRFGGLGRQNQFGLTSGGGGIGGGRLGGLGEGRLISTTYRHNKICCPNSNGSTLTDSKASHQIRTTTKEYRRYDYEPNSFVAQTPLPSQSWVGEGKWKSNDRFEKGIGQDEV